MSDGWISPMGNYYIKMVASNRINPFTLLEVKDDGRVGHANSIQCHGDIIYKIAGVNPWPFGFFAGEAIYVLVRGHGNVLSATEKASLTKPIQLTLKTRIMLALFRLKRGLFYGD